MTTEINFNIISVKEFARKINTPTSTVYEWIRKHIIPESCVKKFGKTIFIKAKHMADYIDD